MRVLVTGAAGFIGSHVAEALIERGDEVVGVDCFLDYYPRAVKERNIARLRDEPRFALIEVDLVEARVERLVAQVDAVVHLAAQAGVRASWGKEFRTYSDANVLATQRLLEACVERGLRFVYSSSSSIYGNAPERPTTEDTLPRPISPYGVSKLAGEHLCRLYAETAGLPAVSLRYFTVYGPRQRPDMAFHRFLRAQLLKEEIVVYDDGEQTRDFTYVGDVVAANLCALERGRPGGVYNIAGGSRVRLNSVLATIAELTGSEPRIRRIGAQRGDVRDTHASTAAAERDLGWTPRTSLRQGLEAELAWLRAELGAEPTIFRR